MYKEILEDYWSKIIQINDKDKIIENLVMFEEILASIASELLSSEDIKNIIHDIKNNRDFEFFFVKNNIFDVYSKFIRSILRTYIVKLELEERSTTSTQRVEIVVDSPRIWTRWSVNEN